MQGVKYSEYADIKVNFVAGKQQMRLQTLLDFIEQRKFVKVMPDTGIAGGQAIISCSDDLKNDMKKVIDGKLKFSEPSKNQGETFYKKYCGPAVLTATYVVGKNQSQKNIRLNQIAKTADFGSSGGSGQGAAMKDLQEGGAAWVGAFRFSLGETDIDSDYQCTLKDFNSVKDKVDTKKSMESIHQYLVNNPDFMTSTILTANSLWNSKYRNKNYNWYHDNNFVKTISNHFAKLNKELGEKDEEGLRPFSNINKWNPADIWLVDPSLTTIPKENYLQGWNQKLYDAIKEKKLIGVSLKKISGTSAKFEEVNMDRDKVITSNYVTGGANSLFNSMDVYIYGQGYELQMRDTAGAGKTWQGEITGGEKFGSSAKGGKVGGGIFNRILKEAFGKEIFHEYTIDQAVTAAESSGVSPLDDKIYKLIKKTKIAKHVVAGKNKDFKKFSRKSTSVSNVLEYSSDTELKERIASSDNRSGISKSQWKFSKYFGLTVLDIFLSGTDNERNDASTRLYRYASSQSELSGPFIKIS